MNTIEKQLLLLVFISYDYNNLNEEIMDNSIGKIDSKRILELNKTNEWKEFKSFWKNIDNVKPENGLGYIFSKEFSLKENYDYTQKYKLMNSLQTRNEELMNKMTELVNKKLLDTHEPSLLFELCDSRIQYVFYGSSNRKTRMMPSLGMQEKDRSMIMFEFKMDTLLNMKKRGNIDTEELNLAMDNILQEVKNVSLLGIIDYHKLLYCFPFRFNEKNESKPNDTLTVVDKTIHDFNTSYKEFMRKYNDSRAEDMQKEMYERYKSVKKELETFTSIYPQFCELIKDLVMNA